MRGAIKDKGLLNIGGAPCCVEVYKYSEYAAARNLASIIGIIKEKEEERILVSNIISLVRFNVGGAAIFALVAINHQKVIAG